MCQLNLKVKLCFLTEVVGRHFLGYCLVWKCDSKKLYHWNGVLNWNQLHFSEDHEMGQAAVTCRFINMVPLWCNSVYRNCIMLNLADITIQYNTIQYFGKWNFHRKELRLCEYGWKEFIGHLLNLRLEPSQLDRTELSWISSWDVLGNLLSFVDQDQVLNKLWKANLLDYVLRSKRRV